MTPQRQTPNTNPVLTPPPTARIRFRTYQSNDVENVVQMFADKDAQRWYPTKAQPHEAQKWIEWNQQNYRQHGIGLWVIESSSTKTFLGDCGLTYQTVEDDQLLEIGYHLQRQHSGNGYAIEAAQHCRDFAFQALNAPTVCSIVDPQNKSSIRVAETIHSSLRTFINPDGNERNLDWTDIDFRPND